MMRLVKKIVILIVLSLILVLACLVLFYPRIAVSVFAKQNNVDISYKKLRSKGLTEIIFSDLKAFDKKQALGLTSSSAVIKLIFNGPAETDRAADFSLTDVSFIRKGPQKEASYNNIDGLIALPFSDLRKYKTISGKVMAIKNGIKVTDFMATGELIRFSCKGSLTYGNIVDGDITIYFEKGVIGNVPAELSGMALKDEDGGWKSLTMKIEGDISKPSIKVTGKMFRLNINSK